MNLPHTCAPPPHPQPHPHERMSSFFAASMGLHHNTLLREPTFVAGAAFALTTATVNASAAPDAVYTPPLLVRRAQAALSAMRRRDAALGMAQMSVDEAAGKRRDRERDEPDGHTCKRREGVCV